MIMFKSICTVFVLLTFAPAPSWAKEIRYPVSAIPDSLIEKAKIVIRNYDQVFEIKSIGSGTEMVTYAITIMNENGLRHAVFYRGYYEKLTKLSGIKGTIYNATGEKVEQLTADKLIDQSAISGYSIYESIRAKYFNPKTLTFPFTVEYSYTTDYNGLLFYPSWDPVIAFNSSLVKSTFKVICPNSLSFRYRENNITSNVSISRNENNTVYTWELQNIAAIEQEPWSGSPYEYFPTVKLAPDDFEMEGYHGNCSSWESFGLWFLELLKNRDLLDEATRQTIQQLVKNHGSDYDRTKAIYEYMQHKTRYVSIQQGLGGWQPFEAETVNRLGYGDCKALTNYMKALLSAAGIKSDYALIRAGEFPNVFYPDFPSNQFNHAILCVPLSNDTIWLECTNQHMPFGYIGSFTDDREALLITETGGKLVHTRRYTAAENLLERNSVLQLDASGNTTLITNTRHNGVFYDDKIGFYLAGTEDRKKMILDEVSLPGAVLKKFDYQDIRTEVPAIGENLEIDVPRYATLAGTRMLVALVPLDRQREVPRKVGNRKSDVVIRRATATIDSVIVIVPDGYQLESVPGEIKVESKFGTYTLKPVVSEGKVICIRSLEMKKGRQAPETYPELIDFYKKIAAADNTKMSLKKSGV